MDSFSSNQKLASIERRKDFSKNWSIGDIESDIEPENFETQKLLWEPCTYEDYHTSLPIDLFSLSKEDFGEIFNVDVLNSLDDEDKVELMKLLPNDPNLNTDDVLKELFSGKTFHFTNPVDIFVENLLEGEYNAEITKYKNTLKILEDKAHHLSFKKYYNKLLRHVLEQKKRVGLEVDEKMLDYYRLDADENDIEERRDVYKARKRLERKLRKRRNEKKVKAGLSKNSLSDIGLELSRSQIAGIPDFSDDLIYSDDDMSSSTASLLSDREEAFSFDFGSQEPDEIEVVKKKRKRTESTSNNTPTSTKRRKEKTRKEKRKSLPPTPFKNIFTLFLTIKEHLESNGPQTIEDIVDSIKDNSKALSQAPTQISLINFFRLALNFLINPPQFLETCVQTQGSNQTETSQHDSVRPFVRKVNDKYEWILDPLSIYVDKVEDLEKLFFFSMSRGQLNEKNDEIDFKFGKHMKSTLTILPSTNEEIEDFQRNETERYSVPEKPFTYISRDMKTTVAPLKKASATTRPHYLLKDDRPPYANLLALVRDSVARLPGGVGTRPDVAILLKDSQFIKEDTKFDSLNSVVSGALDRLHSEEDPCVHYDSNFKLWINVHRQRNEEDYYAREIENAKKLENDGITILDDEDGNSQPAEQVDEEKMDIT